MIIKNRDVIQSYLMTTARYDFSVYEKRILYRLVEMTQVLLDGQKLDKNFTINETLFHDRIVTMPISAFLANEEDENYTRVKQALRDLRNKTFELEDNHNWKLIGIIEKPNLEKQRGYVTFEIQPEVYEAILSFSKGFRKFELKTAMEFKSAYSMRFYELFSGQKNPITYTIEHLKIMFNLETKYIGRPADFINRVIYTAKKELDEKSPYSFNYKEIKQGKKITSIQFSPIYNPKHRDENLEDHQLQKQISIQWDLDQLIIDYLKQNYFFTQNEIKNNIKTLKEAHKNIDLLLLLSNKKREASKKDSPQAWIIGTIKKILIKQTNTEAAKTV